MTPVAHAMKVRPSRYGLAGMVAAERAQVDAGHKPGCRASCACHGNVVCLRAEHPHDPHADMGPNKPCGDVVPHAGYDDTGQLVQWVHTSEHGPEWSAEQVAESKATARREHTEGVLAGLDLTVLAEALAAPLATALARHRARREAA